LESIRHCKSTQIPPDLVELAIQAFLSAAIPHQGMHAAMRFAGHRNQSGQSRKVAKTPLQIDGGAALVVTVGIQARNGDQDRRH
jgi:hypothetical protein